MKPGEEKYLSIITNFGCHFRCTYCITKSSGINVPKTTIKGLDNLTNAVMQTNANIVSLSGGGDPMYDYQEHTSYYDKLFRWSWKNHIPLELHTSYIGCDRLPYAQFYRVVYHCKTIYDLFDIKRDFEEKTRAVFVVTPGFTFSDIDAIATIAKYHPDIDELSFRQMVDENYNPTYYCHDYLKDGHKKRWYYIEQDDYNTYYVNGKIYHKFADIGKEI